MIGYVGMGRLAFRVIDESVGQRGFGWNRFWVGWVMGKLQKMKGL